jgi:hypothetical protein
LPSFFTPLLLPLRDCFPGFLAVLGATGILLQSETSLLN